MISEDYISFDTAKLLKEKGFDWDWSPFYCEQDRNKWRQNNYYTIPNPVYDPNLPFDTETLTAIAPHVSIQMAMKWLREVHNIFIEVSVCERYENKMDDETKVMFFFVLLNLKEKQIIGVPFQYYVHTYEEAAEAGIKYCLENLI